jgi:hypothetical protein
VVIACGTLGIDRIHGLRRLQHHVRRKNARSELVSVSYDTAVRRPWRDRDRENAEKIDQAAWREARQSTRFPDSYCNSPEEASEFHREPHSSPANETICNLHF